MVSVRRPDVSDGLFGRRQMSGGQTVLHSSVTEATPVRAVSGCRFIYFRFAAVICRVRGGIAAN